MPRETAREVSSTSAQVWYILDMVEKRRGAAVECGLALLCGEVEEMGSC